MLGEGGIKKIKKNWARHIRVTDPFETKKKRRSKIKVKSIS